VSDPSAGLPTVLIRAQVLMKTYDLDSLYMGGLHDIVLGCIHEIERRSFLPLWHYLHRTQCHVYER
jgi:hypothetical protein